MGGWASKCQPTRLSILRRQRSSSLRYTPGPAAPGIPILTARKNKQSSPFFRLIP